MASAGAGFEKGGKTMGEKPVQQPKRQRVSFFFQQRDASRVSLVGDFNDWDPKRQARKRDQNGTW